LDVSVFVPEQHWPQQWPQAQLVATVVVAISTFAMSNLLIGFTPA